jgi:transposase
MKHELSKKVYLDEILEGGMKRVEVCRRLKISRMTLWRKLGRYREYGIMGLEHGLTGRAGNRHNANPNKERIIGLCGEKYYDCGPTLASEHLEDQEGLMVHPETLRRWLHEAGIMHKTRKRKPYRQRRPRKLRFGDMLQIDGSFHDWFGTGEKACLMNLIDDAGGTDLCRFEIEETIEGACLLLWDWCRRYGIPRSIYSDRRNMYDPDKDGEHFFTSMCLRLGIRLIMANSPQAKGRVERSNRTHQERLMPWLRLRGIKTMGEANKALPGYLAGHNKKFTVQPGSMEDGHRALKKGSKLEDYCYIESPRKISNDWVVSYNGKKYQLKPGSMYCPTKATVMVRQTLLGKITISYRNRPLNYVSF